MVLPKKNVMQKTFIGSAEKVDAETNKFRESVESLGTQITAIKKSELLREDEIVLVCTVFYQKC